MIRRRALTLAMGGLAAAAAAPVRAQTVRTLPLAVILTTTADALPFYYALAQGLFGRGGLDVTATFVSSGSAGAAAVAGGAAQVGYSNTFSAAQAHVRGIPFVLIAPGGQHDPASPNSEMFVARDAPYKAAKDLDGKVVGVVSLHDLQTLSARAFIDAAGGDSASVKFLEMPQSAMLEALTAKRVDAIVSYEPFRSNVEASGGARSLGAPFNAISREMMYTAWIALSTWVDVNREAASRYAQVIRAATDYTNAHYMELLPLLSSVTKLPLESIQRSHRIRDAVALAPNLVQPVIDTAAKYKEIPAPFPATEMIASGLAT